MENNDVGDGVIIPAPEQPVDPPERAEMIHRRQHSLAEKIVKTRQIVADIKIGVSLVRACEKQDVCPQTFRNWRIQFGDQLDSIMASQAATESPIDPPPTEQKSFPLAVRPPPADMPSLTVQQAIEFVKQNCSSCVIAVEAGSAIFTEIKGSKKDYDMLLAVVGLRAFRDYKEEIRRT